MQMVDFDGFDVLDFCRQMMEEERIKNYPFNDYKWNLGSYWFEKIEKRIDELIYNSSQTNTKQIMLFGYEVEVNYNHSMEISFVPKNYFI